MKNMKDHFDSNSIVVIIITFVLFIAALWTKGLTHDLLLEAGIFLVSVKLILMAYKQSKAYKKIITELKQIKVGIESLKK